MDKHTSKSYDEQLHAIESDFLHMGKLAIANLSQAIDALKSEDHELAMSVIDLDKQVNEYERQIDDQIVKLVAIRQPTAVDLRYVMSVSKAVTDLERIGDEAVKIARIALYDTPIRVNIELLAGSVRVMTLDALEAFANHDSRFAFDVIAMDEMIDKDYANLISCLQEDDDSVISEIMHTLWVLRALERIGDHARNIAQLVIYINSGKDVRHAQLSDVQDVLDE